LLGYGDDLRHGEGLLMLAESRRAWARR
jgi:hypothetical protein